MSEGLADPSLTLPSPCPPPSHAPRNAMTPSPRRSYVCLATFGSFPSCVSSPPPRPFPTALARRGDVVGPPDEDI
ncbi:hypothetical protein E2C01_080509 [Portunus trituberculatus]|uniref:Uncharacterized protein n=1 Tax=Portunus trituberculatus TaxID=210409 RepID=A0A5B7IPF4_PORTR|nr:hypothetical protein [Portunus trituberculatus]